MEHVSLNISVNKYYELYKSRLYDLEQRLVNSKTDTEKEILKILIKKMISWSFLCDDYTITVNISIKVYNWLRDSNYLLNPAVDY